MVVYLIDIKISAHQIFLAHIEVYSIKLCQWLATGRRFSPGTLVSSTNKTDHHHIAEILLKVALNTINPNLTHISGISFISQKIGKPSIFAKTYLVASKQNGLFQITNNRRWLPWLHICMMEIDLSLNKLYYLIFKHNI